MPSARVNLGTVTIAADPPAALAVTKLQRYPLTHGQTMTLTAATATWPTEGQGWPRVKQT